MPQPADLCFASIADVGARMRDGRLSPVALVERCLARIAAVGPALNAFVTVVPDLARDRAREAERELGEGRRRGALHGVPVAVKDFYDTAGIRTTAAAADLARRVPSRDAVLVGQLRDAGAVLVGKTNMHTLGMGTTSLESHFGPVVNPWSPAHVAGGSSGGSAAAVAAGLCFATVDTDAVGSGRLPAALCGVTCLKPTFGILSTEGILAGEPVDDAILLLGHPSVMARSAEDVALAFASLAGIAIDETAPSRWKVRVGVVRNCTATDEVRSVFETALTPLSAMGLEVRETTVSFAAASFDVRHIDRDRSSANDVLFRDADVLVLPTLTEPAPRVEEARARGELAVSPANTFFCNYYGVPAITVPGGVAANGVPLGLQMVGRRGADADLLALARAYQRAAGWRFAPPPGAHTRDGALEGRRARG